MCKLQAWPTGASPGKQKQAGRKAIATASHVQDENAHHQSHCQQVDELTGKVQRLEEGLRNTTTDFIVARRDKQAAEAQAAAASAKLSEERHRHTQKVAISRISHAKSTMYRGLQQLDVHCIRLHGVHMSVRTAS